MTPALALLAGALAAGWLVPGFLRRIDPRRHDPMLLIVVWHVSMLGVVLSATLGVVLLLAPKHNPGMTLLAAIHECWSAIQHGSPPQFEELAGLLGAALVTAFALRLGVILVRSIRRRGHKHREYLSALRLIARSEPGAPDTLWLPHDRPLAFSMAARPGVVVATDGLHRHLDPAAVDAVFAHERAHLAGRHHLLVAVTEAIRTAVPFVPLFRQAPHAISELVEHAADVVAVRSCGRNAVRAALLTVSRHGAPAVSLAMAQHAIDARMARLDVGPTPPGRMRRILSYGMASVASAALPLLTGIGLLAGLALVSCA